MKKLLLFCASLFFTGMTIYSQTILLESFENGGAIPANWASEIVTGSTNGLTYVTSGNTGFPSVNLLPYNLSYMVMYNSYSIASGSTRLYTANISTVGYSQVTMDFAMYHDNGYFPYNGEGITPQYSIDNGVTWTNIGTVINRSDAINGWQIHTVTLPAPATGIANLRIAFLFTSLFGNNCFMDFVHVNGTTLPSTIPTLSQWGLIILSFLLLALGTVFILKRQNSLAIVRRKK